MARRSSADSTAVRWEFDPAAIAIAESDAWVTYYRHEWGKMLGASLRLVRHGFRMDPARTTIGAWYVLRANMKWAPYPENDPDGATEQMRRFFRLVIRPDTPERNARTAAVREVAWWRAHREHQHRNDGAGPDAGAGAGGGVGVGAGSQVDLPSGSAPPGTDLVEALAASYGYLYQVDLDTVREAARLRAEAMDISDLWVAAGCRLDDPLLLKERRLLLDSYVSLRAAVIVGGS